MHSPNSCFGWLVYLHNHIWTSTPCVILVFIHFDSSFVIYYFFYVAASYLVVGKLSSGLGWGIHRKNKIWYFIHSATPVLKTQCLSIPPSLFPLHLSWTFTFDKGNLLPYSCILCEGRWWGGRQEYILGTYTASSIEIPNLRNRHLRSMLRQ